MQAEGYVAIIAVGLILLFVMGIFISLAYPVIIVLLGFLKPTDQPDDQPGDRPGDQPDDQPGDQPDDRPADRPAGPTSN
ncbi:MAG: hypothetical protein HC884_14140 [Chloroflexaceae bacterium]|nr:hypothetical protein [Chloroflexaceae bacterium]